MAEEFPDAPIEVTDATFNEVIHRYSLVVIDFWAEWCGPCRMLAPTINDLAKEYSGKVVFGKLNTDENQETAARFGIMGIPTLLIFKDGELKDTIVGVLPKGQIEAKIKNLLS